MNFKRFFQVEKAEERSDIKLLINIVERIKKIEERIVRLEKYLIEREAK
ncbi:MAG: hypothetical protein WC758_08045 [Candidatus Woesearchaeota archaeon]|jgi:hypothetical protein